MSKPTMKVINLDQFHGQLQKLSEAARDQTLGRAVKAGGLVIEGFAKQNVQAQRLIDTGNLLNSIQVQDVKSSSIEAEALIGTNVIYATIHEFGGTIVARNGRGMVFQIDGQWIVTQSVTIPARPYMRPAVDEHESEIESAVANTLFRDIEKAAGA